ncbi:MAG: SMP-30/gluconolactonase/LRE family protein [Chloroflexi bacterium]|nr:SMP-30/gluconolactonase/LRE family protein [Chloroflexota bacterium]
MMRRDTQLQGDRWHEREQQRRSELTHLLVGRASVFLVVAVVAVLCLLVSERIGYSAGSLPIGDPSSKKSTAWISNNDPANPIPQQPMAIALLRRGDVLVADTGLAQVHRFGPDGRLRRSYSGSGQLRYPVGLAVSEDDRVWVADLWQQRVYRLDLDHDEVAALSPNAPDYRLPGSLAYQNGRLYVGDFGRQQVLVLTLSGELVRVIGAGPGRAPEQLAYPNGLWIGPDAEVFVSDTNNRRIQVFDAEGRLQRVLQPRNLQLPRGIVADSQGRLYVADTLAHEVAVLDRNGVEIARHGSDEDLGFPNGLAIRDRRLYVADRANSRVVVWELGRD